MTLIVFALANASFPFATALAAEEGVAYNEALVEKYLDSQSPPDAFDIAGELFSKASDSQLRAMILHDSPTISIRAAFEAYHRTLPDNADADRAKQIEASVALVRNANWLVGFIEGRVNTSVPTWWARALKSGRRDQMVFYPDLPSLKKFYTEDEKSSLVTNKECRIEVDADSKELLRVGNRLSVPLETLTANCNYHVTGFNACIGKNAAYVAMLSEKGYPYDVVCLSLADGKQRWIAHVVSNGPLLNYGNRNHIVPSLCTISESRGRVLVFGGYHFGMYIECFSAATGNLIFRMNSGY